MIPDERIATLEAERDEALAREAVLREALQAIADDDGLPAGGHHDATYREGFVYGWRHHQRRSGEAADAALSPSPRAVRLLLAEARLGRASLACNTGGPGVDAARKMLGAALRRAVSDLPNSERYVEALDEYEAALEALCALRDGEEESDG